MSDAVHAIIDHLLELFPDCFNRDAPKPLKIGIYPELRARAKQQPALATVPHEALRQALQVYTQSPAYQRALAQGGPRYDLNGRLAGEVTPAHQAYATLTPAQRQPKKKNKKSTSVAPSTTPLLELTALLPELIAMAIPGKLDVTLKINTLPQGKLTAAQSMLFAVQAEGRTVVVELKDKVWDHLKTAADSYPQWVAAITGKLGEAIEGGFRLENPTLQVFEKKAKPDVATPPPPAPKAPVASPAPVVSKASVASPASVVSKASVAPPASVVSKASVAPAVPVEPNAPVSSPEPPPAMGRPKLSLKGRGTPGSLKG